MADEREVFTVLEASTGEGVSWVYKNIGDAVAGVTLAPVVNAVDKDGNFAFIPIEVAGEAVGNAVPVLGAKDISGQLQYINLREEGDAVSAVGAQPALVAKDPSGNFDYLNINADGELVISNQPNGTVKNGNGTVAGVVGTLTEVLAISLTSSKVYENLDFIVSATFTTLWKFFNVDDADGTPVETEIAQCITGPGQFSLPAQLENLTFTAGSTGNQELVIKGKQLIGKATDLHATVSIFEKA